MAQEDFLKQLWRTIRHSAPTGTADGSVDTPVIQRQLTATDLWLTPKVVEEYRSEDFADWPGEARVELATAVEGFLAVLPTAPAKTEQRAVAAEWFMRIVNAVRPMVRDNWVSAVESLVAETESWCRARDWLSRRLPNKVIVEPLTGRYEAAQLLIHLAEGRFILTPVSRFVAGGTGLMDLYAMPALGGRSIIRRDEGWDVLPASSKERPKPWSRAAFENAILLLSRDAA